MVPFLPLHHLHSMTLLMPDDPLEEGGPLTRPDIILPKKDGFSTAQTLDNAPEHLLLWFCLFKYTRHKSKAKLEYLQLKKPN